MIDWGEMDAAARLAWAEETRTKCEHLAKFTSDELIRYRTLSDHFNALARECRGFAEEIETLRCLLAETETLRDAAEVERDAYQATIEANAAQRRWLGVGHGSRLDDARRAKKP
jgi:hypothetical protein